MVIHSDHPYRARPSRYSHEGEGGPLDPKLGNAQQAGDAVECLQLLATGDVLPRLRQEEDVGEGRRR